VSIRFALDGQPTTVDAPPMSRLLDVLRVDCGLTGSKEGCGEGECGACTVRIDGRVAMSCLVPLYQVEGCRVSTVEGVAADPRLRRVADALLAHGGAQCGICTPGFVVSAAALLDERTAPTREEIRVALAGNLCRCTGYQKIVDAVAAALAEDRDAPV
jgi:carbon-monoxide dehydrogenase small subunit